MGTLGWGARSEDVHQAAMRLVDHWMNLRASRMFVQADEIKSAARELGVELRVVGERSNQKGQAVFSESLNELP